MDPNAQAPVTQQPQVVEPPIVSKHFHLPRVLLVLLVALISAGVFGALGYFLGMSHQAQQNITATPTTRTTTQTKVSIEPTAAVSPTLATTTSGNLIPIKELGISITVPDAIKDIVYSPQTVSTNISADFSTTSLTSLDPGCSDTGSAPPLGSLEKINGQYNSLTPAADSQFVKQFPTFYIMFSHSQALCNRNQSLSNKVTTEAKTFQDSLSTIQELK